jgi:predicted ATPase
MIKRIVLANFKSLGKVSIELEPITVLIGKSGAGKTNIVQAIQFFRDLLLGDKATFNRHGGWQTILPAGAKLPLTVGFRIDFEIPGVTGAYHYELEFVCPLANSASLEKEVLALGGCILFHQQGRKWIEPPKVIPLPNPGSFALGAITGSQEVAIAHVFLTEGIGCYSFGERIMLGGPTQNEIGAGFGDRGQDYVRTFARIVNNLQALSHWKEIVASVQKLNSSVTSIELSAPDRGKIMVGHAAGDSSLVLELSRESDGFRRFFAHLIALYQTPPKQLLIFEHPETGIHPGALAMLADEFEACASSGRGQILLTTHSPDLLNSFAPESVRLVEMDNCTTSVSPVSSEQVEVIRDQLLQTGELLTVDPARPAVPAHT